MKKPIVYIIHEKNHCLIHEKNHCIIHEKTHCVYNPWKTPNCIIHEKKTIKSS